MPGDGANFLAFLYTDIHKDEAILAEPTLSDVFGNGATQTASTLAISKADMASVGLSPSASNTAESMLVSILLYAAIRLTEAARTADQANRNITVYSGGQDITGSPPNVFLRDVYSVLMYRPTTIQVIDPDNY